jgi:hypothetical protein
MQRYKIRQTGIGIGTTAVLLAIASSCLLGRAFAAQEEGKQAPRDRDAVEAEDAEVTYTPPLSQADRAVFVALRRKIDFDIHDMPLRTLAATLAKQMGVKVVVVSSRDVRPGTTVDIKCRKTPLESILRETLTPLALDYRVKQGRLEITRRDSGNVATRTYSVADICPTTEAVDKLIGEIHSLYHESEWEETGGWASISALGRNFALVHLQSEQEHVLRLLTEKRREAKENPAGKKKPPLHH